MGPWQKRLEYWRRRYDLTDFIVWLFGFAILAVAVYGTIRSLQTTTYDLKRWIDFTIYGISLGGMYALIALGYTLVYGILFMINFAHGEIFMFGSFGALFTALILQRKGLWESRPILSLILVTLAAMVVASAVAVLVERVAYRPLRRAPRLIPLITAIGASFTLQYTARSFFGSGLRAFPEQPFLKGSVNVLGINVGKPHLLAIVTSILMMIGLYAYVRYTKTGKAMRAVAENKDVAALMGIDVDQIIVRTFILGASMAGVAGVLYSLIFVQVKFFMGFIPGIKAFTAAVLGGIGNIPGAMLGGYFLGVFESIGPALILEGLGIPAPTQLKDVIAFTMLVMVLIFRPTGILGEAISEKRA